MAPLPDDYRGPYRRGDPRAGAKYAAHVAEIVKGLQANGRRTRRLPGRDPAQRGRADRAPARATWPRPIAPCAPRPGCASRTRCRWASAAWARTSGGSRPRAWCPTSWCWASPSATGSPWPPWSPPRRSRAPSTTAWSSSAPSAATPWPAPSGLAVLDVLEEERLQERALRVGSHLRRRPSGAPGAPRPRGRRQGFGPVPRGGARA